MRFTLCSLYLALHYGRKLPRIQIGVLGHSLVRLLVPSHRSLVRSLAHFAHSLARGTVNDWMAILSVFFPIFDHSAFRALFKLESNLSGISPSIICKEISSPNLLSELIKTSISYAKS